MPEILHIYVIITILILYYYIVVYYYIIVSQLVKNLSAMRETWVRSLGWDDPLEEDIATHSSILAWRTPMDRGALTGYSPSGCSTSQTLLSD